MSKQVKNLMIPSKLVELAKEHFKTENVSEAVYKCIEYAILFSMQIFPSVYKEIYFVLTIEERKLTRQYSIRLEDWLCNALCSATKKDLTTSVTMAILCTLKNDISSDSAPSIVLGKKLKIINILGSKWNEKMQSAIKKILDTSQKHWNTSIETCAGALGIHANFMCAENEIINDDDADKINLYRCIQKYPLEFKCKAITFEINQDSFNKLKKEKIILNDTPNVDAAVRYFILNNFTSHNSGSTFQKKSEKAILKKLDCVGLLSRRLQNVTIMECDIFQIIKKYHNVEDTLFFVDPPYIDTNVYKTRKIRKPTEHGSDFRLEEHEQLAKKLLKIKGDFIYFCRITAPRRCDSNCNLRDTPEALKKADTILQGRIDDMYWGQGLFYVDVAINENIVERIITNFKFDGSTAYTKQDGEVAENE
jgi:site-specific DNA-adenine methylase